MQVREHSWGRAADGVRFSHNCLCAILTESLPRSLIKRALAQAHDNKSRAAEILKINQRLLYDKLQEFGMD